MIKEILKDKARLLVFLYFPFYLISWFVIQQVLSPEDVYVWNIALDNKIPFIEFFIVFYCLWFIYYAATLVFFMFKERENFIRLGSMLIFGITVSLCIFIFFQNAVDLRPEVLPVNAFGKLTGLIYEIDPPTSACPSLHCFVAISLAVGFAKSEKYSKNKWWAMILSLLICLSTLFVKQHSVIDFAAAAALAIPSYLFGYKLINVKENTAVKKTA